jgi:hypothetical protein
LRLLAEEIASVEEDLAYEEKANEERVAIERDACQAPQGETWNTLVRQEGSLDRSIDRKVRILLGLRKESAGLAAPPASQNGGGQRESTAEAVGSVPENAELVKAAGNIKLKERSGDLSQNQGWGFENLPESGKVMENTGGNLHHTGMPLGRQGGIGSEALAVALLGLQSNAI